MGFSRLFEQKDNSRRFSRGNDPVGSGASLTAELRSALGASVGHDVPSGIRAGQALLDKEGKADPRIANEKRKAADRDRQSLQQSITQSSGQSGLTGSAGAAAISQQADLAGAAKQNQIARDTVFAEEDQRRADLSLVLGNLLQQPSLDLGSGQIQVPEDRRKTGFRNFFGTAGNVFGAIGPLFAGGSGGEGAASGGTT